jgi:hypothetical protein
LAENPGPASGNRVSGKGNAAFAQRVAVALDVHIGRQGTVGQHHVETVDRQLGCQLFQPAFLACQPDRFGQREGGRQQLVGDCLGHDVGDADPKRMHARGSAVLQGFLELGADLEDFVGVGERGAPGVGQFEPAPAAAEQRHPEALLEGTDLSGKRLRRQVQFLGGAVDGAGLGDGAEVVQVLVIQHGRFRFDKIEQ